MVEVAVTGSVDVADSAGDAGAAEERGVVCGLVSSLVCSIVDSAIVFKEREGRRRALALVDEGNDSKKQIYS